MIHVARDQSVFSYSTAAPDAARIKPGVAMVLMSSAGQLQASQVVDPLKTARYVMPTEILARSGLDLL